MTGDPKDWGKYFRELFREGEKFTEALLHENERLRQRVALMDHEVQSASHEQIQLRQELVDLKRKFTTVEQDNQEFAKKYMEVERNNSHFASLYVASYQLHSTLDPDLVKNFICEIVINLIGVDFFDLYLHDTASRSFVVAAGMGPLDRIGSRVPFGDNLLSKVAETGKLYLAENTTEPGSLEKPIAVLPLMVSRELMGVLAIYKLLSHKKQLEPIDMELFDLLSVHAGTALLAARLFTQSTR